jgi:hypothetical protein
MNKTATKTIRKQVFADFFKEDISVHSKKDAREATMSPEFKSMFRAAKKNRNYKKTIQHPKLKVTKRQRRLSLK